MTGKSEDDRNKSSNVRDYEACSENCLPEGVTGADALQILQSLVKNKVLNSDQIKQFAPTTNSASKKKNNSFSGNGLPKNKKSKTSSSSKIVPNFPENTRFRHIALRFQYDGSSYSGFTENVNDDEDYSIEKELFAALQKTHLIKDRFSCQYSRCGRTDRGVSAFGQVIALHVKSAFSLNTKKVTSANEENGTNVELSLNNSEELPVFTNDDLPNNSIDKVVCLIEPRKKKKKTQNGNDMTKWEKRIMKELNYPLLLNNVLPPSIRVLGWSPVTPDFSARFSCSRRTYRYFFHPRNLNLHKMQQAMDGLVGQKLDFRNFCKMNCEQVYNFERVLYSAKIVNNLNSEKDDGCYFEIEGQAFLWHQIRCIVSILFMVGKELEPPSIVNELLDVTKNPGKPSYNMAPDGPLVLHKCNFDHVTFGHSVKNLWRTTSHWEQQWHDVTLKSNRIRNGITSLQMESLVDKRDVLSHCKELLEEKQTKESRRGETYKYHALLQQVEVEIDKNEKVIMSWGDALLYIEKMTNGLRPEIPKEAVHVPLMERSKGTTYEEKVQAIMNSSNNTTNNYGDGDDDVEETSRRKERYQENIITKRKTPEEDQAFYRHMLKQGGSGI